jgi:hypothetical protein
MLRWTASCQGQNELFIAVVIAALWLRRFGLRQKAPRSQDPLSYLGKNLLACYVACSLVGFAQMS